MSKTDLYPLLSKQAGALLEARFGLVSNMANLAALIYHTLPDINWAGFYLLDKNILRLGPFQGKPACTEIPLGKGVCGTAALQQKTLVVPDVHQFTGHIACDSASKSEIVIPLLQDEKVWGVLDIDSPVLNRFDEMDRAGLEEVVRVFASVVQI
ncbi:MAG: GAF domain-containing protein [Elusimicrobiaceae bacterium]|nr:GAF domain-containing protein [Elusimicrobiaceae bacterium]